MSNTWETTFPMQRRVLLVRHGQATGNLDHRFLGLRDDALTDMGQQQAKALANHLDDTPIQAIYSSPLQRAAETARVIAASKTRDFTCDDRLKEQDFGAWDGLTLDSAMARYPEDFKRRHHHQPGLFAPTDGETMGSLCERVGAFAEDLCERYQQGETVVVVGHAGVFQAILCTWFGMTLSPTWPFRLNNGSITEIQFREMRPVLVQLSVQPPLT